MQGSSKRLKGVKVLVVEDCQDSRELVRFVLEQEGATVTDFESVATALAGFAKEPPDVCVVDIGMPTHNGYVFIAKIRGRNDQTPAIALTAFTTSTDRDVALAAGFQLHMGKPFEPARLVDAVARLTDTRQSSRVA